MDTSGGREPPLLEDVHQYWSTTPIFSLEVQAEPGTAAFYEAVDRLKRTDVERFGIGFWRFDRCRGLKVLELGCGSGWLSANYVRGGADLVATDLTQRAVDLTRRYLDMMELQAVVSQANAEALPFEAASFDLVVASGVIHHTPGVAEVASEIARVLKPGGAALLSVYYRNGLLQPYSFWLTRRAIRLFSIQSRAFGRSTSIDDFTRRYDGDANPLGRAYSKKDLLRLFRELRLQRFEVHYFPTRFLPIVRAGGPFHRILDRWLGTMLYAEFRKHARAVVS
jgi:SAM-dependent methyltransferase